MRLAGVLSMALALAATPAMAQDAASDSADPNLRQPEIFSVDVEGTRVQYVIGDGAWGNIYANLAQIRRLPAENDAEVIERLWAERDNTAPIFLMEVARRAAPTNPELAIEAYLLGRVRTIYDISRCLDSTSAGILPVVTSQAGPEVEGLLNDRIAHVSVVLENMYSEGAAFTGTTSPWWACSFGDAAFFAAANGVAMSGQEWLKVESRWATEQGNINENLLQQIMLLRTALATLEAQ